MLSTEYLELWIRNSDEQYFRDSVDVYSWRREEAIAYMLQMNASSWAKKNYLNYFLRKVFGLGETR